MSNRKLSDAARHILAARAFLEQGWVKGSTRTREGVCMLGALHVAETDDKIYIAAHSALALALRERGWSDHLPMFNDSDATRLEDVLSVFDRAAELA